MIKKEDLYFERGIVLTFVGITREKASEILGHDPQGNSEEDAIILAAIQEASGIDAEPIDSGVDEDGYYLVYRSVHSSFYPTT